MTLDEIKALRRNDLLYRVQDLDGNMRVIEWRLDCPKVTDMQMSWQRPSTVLLRRTKVRAGAVLRVSVTEMVNGFALSSADAVRLFLASKWDELKRAEERLLGAKVAAVVASAWQAAWNKEQKVW